VLVGAGGRRMKAEGWANSGSDRKRQIGRDCSFGSPIS
jgi:hypothetical protein